MGWQTKKTTSGTVEKGKIGERDCVPVAERENEHVRHERAKATHQSREAVHQMTRIHTVICPEYGRAYLSSGKATTAKSNPEA